MNIAYFVTSFPTLSQTFVLNQLTGLIDRGHELTIYSRKPGDDTPHPDVATYDLLSKTKFCRVLSVNPLARAWTALRLLSGPYRSSPAKAARALNIPKYRYRALSLELLFTGSVMLGSEAGSHDVVHGHFAPNGITIALLRDIGLLQGKIVTTFHDYGLTWYLRKWGPRVYDHLFANGDLFLAISDYARNRMIELGCPHEKVVVHRMGVDCQRFSPSHRSARASQGLVQILCVGRFAEKKGFEYAIRAAANLRDSQSQFEMTIIGDGELRSELKQLVHELDADAFIHLPGLKTQDQVAAALHDADIFLAPSVTASSGDAEGIPVVLMEAMAAGLPIVSTQHAAIPELVRDETTGYLAEERDVDALTQRLDALIKDDALRQRLGTAGRMVVETEFNIDTLNDQLIARFQELL